MSGTERLPTGSWFVVAAVELTRFTRERPTRHVQVTLSAVVIVAATVLAVVTGAIGCDESSVEILARVS